MHDIARRRRFPSLGSRPTSLKWMVLVLISAALVVVLEVARLPAALMLGPLIAGIILASLDGGLKVTAMPFNLAQGVIGCMVARSITVPTLVEILHDWPIFLAGVVSVVIASSALGWLLARNQVLPGTVAIWGSSPGAASAMMLMAEAYGADIRLVAFMQYLRIVFVAIAASAVGRYWSTGAPGPAVATDWFPPVTWLPFAGTLVLVIFCLALAKRFKLPAGPVLLTLAVAAFAQDTGLLTIELPPWLLALSYTLIGWSVGLRFTRPILAHAGRALPRVVASIIALIGICGLFAVALTYIAGVDPLTAYLATSPGGVDSVAIIAASSKVDVPFVLAMQTARLVIVISAGPHIARFIARRITAAHLTEPIV